MSPHPDAREDFKPDWPPPFRATVLMAERLRSAQSIIAGNTHYLIQEKKLSGYLIFASFVLEDQNNLFIQIDLDGQTLIRDTHDDFEAAAAGDLNIDTADAAGNLIHIPDSSASYYTVILDMHARPWPFGRSLEVFIENDHATTTYKLQSALILYSVSRAGVFR